MEPARKRDAEADSIRLFPPSRDDRRARRRRNREEREASFDRRISQLPEQYALFVCLNAFVDGSLAGLTLGEEDLYKLSLAFVSEKTGVPESVLSRFSTKQTIIGQLNEHKLSNYLYQYVKYEQSGDKIPIAVRNPITDEVILPRITSVVAPGVEHNRP